MKKLHALPNGAGLISHNPAFRSILINLVTPETRAHEKAQELAQRNVPSVFGGRNWRKLVRHLVRYNAA